MIPQSGELVVGKRYRVVYRQQGGNFQWYEKVFVGTYMGEDYKGEYIFSLRPVGGTGNVPKANVLRMDATVEDVYAPRSYRGEGDRRV